MLSCAKEFTCVILLIPTMTLKGKYYYPPFTDGNVRAHEVVICPGFHSRKGFTEIQIQVFLSPDPSISQRHTNAHAWMCRHVHRGSRPRAAPGPGGLQQRQDRHAQDRASFVWLHFKQRQQQGNRSPPLPFSEDQSESKNRSQEAFDPNVSNEHKHPAYFAIRSA